MKRGLIITLLSVFLVNTLMAKTINGVQANADTLSIFFDGNEISYSNPFQSDVSINQITDSAIVDIVSKKDSSFVLMLSGNTDYYKLRVSSDSAYTLILNGISMTSNSGLLYKSFSNGIVTIELADKTDNYFNDSKESSDTTINEKGCIDSQSSIIFTGNGKLRISSENRHAIYSSGGVCFSHGLYDILCKYRDGVHAASDVAVTDSHVNISSYKADCIESDGAFIMNGGELSMFVYGIANEGIKCKDSIHVSGGKIRAIGMCAKQIKDESAKYSSLLKSSGDITITGGNVNLLDYSEGGESIVAGNDVLIAGGNVSIINNGYGGNVLNEEEDGYFTSKCIEAKRNVVIKKGTVNCLATGTGGKGIVGKERVIFGDKVDKSFFPVVNVTTIGSCLVNDTIRDKRYGCPKGIKASDRLYVYNGSINVATRGMGGEGLESRNSLFIYDGEIICNTFDDGINVANKINIFGGTIYCISSNNDGIDSNGRLTLEGGTVVSISQNVWGESFDSDDSIVIKGGTILGIGNDRVKISESSLFTLNTQGYWDNNTHKRRTDINISSGEYLHLVLDEKLILTLKNDYDIDDAFITIFHPLLKKDSQSYLCISDKAINPQNSFFKGRISVGGLCPEERKIIAKLNN